MTRVSWRRIVLLLVPPLGLLVAAIVLAPLPRGIAGSTRCMPFVGPRLLIDSALSGRDRILVIAHEQAHATQCRQDGVLGNYVRRLTRNGRLRAELGAYCAEGRAELRFGHRAENVVARILDELQEGYPWFRRIPRRELLTRFAAECPDLVRPPRAPLGSRTTTERLM
jgi:hypothetical protein